MKSANNWRRARVHLWLLIAHQLTWWAFRAVVRAYDLTDAGNEAVGQADAILKLRDSLLAVGCSSREAA